MHFDSLVDVFCVNTLWLEELSRYGQLGLGASSQQSLCWTQIHMFCRGVSCCKYCEVGVTVASLCLPENALGRLDGRFSVSICLLMTRAACPVVKTPFSSKLSKFVRNAVSCKVALQFFDTCGRLGVSEPVNFPEIGEIVHSDEMIFVDKGADVHCNPFA